MELKMENPTHSFRETYLVPQLIEKTQIKSRSVMSWSSSKKPDGIFCTIYFLSEGIFQKNLKTS